MELVNNIMFWFCMIFIAFAKFKLYSSSIGDVAVAELAVRRLRCFSVLADRRQQQL